MKPAMTQLPTLIQSAADRIRFAGRARNVWSDFLTGLRKAVSKIDGQPVTELIGVVADQPALFGLLCHVRDLGVPLVSVEYLPNHKKENL